MRGTPPHLKTLEVIEKTDVPGLVEVLREESLDVIRYVLWTLRADPRPIALSPGTPERNLPATWSGGLENMRRHHVHLSPDEATATVIGRGRGWPVVLDVKARTMPRDGWEFYRSGDGMWLVEQSRRATSRAAAPGCNSLGIPLV